MAVERADAQASIKDLYRPFLIQYQGLRLPVAGLPGADSNCDYRRLFPRDGLTKELLDPEPETLRNWVVFVGRNLGKKKDPVTGEIKGGGPHEVDPRTGDGYHLDWAPELSTKYNSHDVTALWFMGFEKYVKMYGDRELVAEFKQEIMDGVGWVEAHVKDRRFKIDPTLSGAKRFALHITYWKDSQIPDSNRLDPQFAYPATVPLVQAQNTRGLESAAFLLDEALGGKYQDQETAAASIKSKVLTKQMRLSLRQELFDHEKGTFFIAQDEAGAIRGASSDHLLMLFFTDPSKLTSEVRRSVLKATQVLESAAGFLGVDPEIGSKLKDQYHAIVWPWENCAINRGVVEHLRYVEGRPYRTRQEERLLYEEADLLIRAEGVSVLPRRYFNGTYPETLDPRSGVVEKKGCDPQLWTVAAEENYRRHYPKAI